MSNITAFADLVDSLKTPLPTEASRAEELRSMIAFAESNGIIISQYVRTLSQELDELIAEKLAELRKSEDYTKSNADEKKLLLNASVAQERSRLEWAEKLEVLIKQRCSLGQSLLNSLNNEIKSSFNK